MQLFARSRGGTLIRADLAERGEDYFCNECQALLRLRGGIHRQPHFFHIGERSQCRQAGKSLAHLQLQLSLKELLGEVELEHRFESCSRIADIYWPEKKLIIEIQCSPISAEELLERNDDYGSLDLEMLWIFHDQRYNKRRLTAAEAVAPRYLYSNGEQIYHQQRIISDGLVQEWLPKQPIDLRYLPRDLPRDLHQSQQKKRSWLSLLLFELLDRSQR